ncbi:hypothetical protein [Streptomyces sp. CC77]|uniref:hypothetical protein n=1 Tax=Streptomyces sp. CC77 TaxID=1906739 RepID=UPI0008DDBF2B|nr:hypothetical protein [Streptomyces sp. CC77]OII66607.1 hypothetical protein BJP39_08330 [Streptomyces sp. CC77]
MMLLKATNGERAAYQESPDLSAVADGWSEAARHMHRYADIRSQALTPDESLVLPEQPAEEQR